MVQWVSILPHGGKRINTSSLQSQTCDKWPKGTSVKYRIYGHRHADYLFKDLDEYSTLYEEIIETIESITDEMIVTKHRELNRDAKSISEAINKLIKEGLTEKGWHAESFIFADSKYRQYENGLTKGTWRLDFAKDSLSVEVAFNHRSDISWNMIKPVLASELNHVQKSIQTSGGVIVTATEAMKKAGGYDSAIGTFEDYVQYCTPLYGMLPTPLLIIGLEAPESFSVSVRQVAPRKKVGFISYYLIKSEEGEMFCGACGAIVPEITETCPECGESLTPKWHDPESLFALSDEDDS
jgi:hypothetical protein